MHIKIVEICCCHSESLGGANKSTTNASLRLWGRWGGHFAQEHCQVLAHTLSCICTRFAGTYHSRLCQDVVFMIFAGKRVGVHV